MSERIIDTIISNQFSSASQATSHHNTVELSGFGKFTFSQLRAKKLMAKYHSQLNLYDSIISDPNSSPALVHNNTLRKQTTLNNIEHLKPKIR